MTEIAQTDPAEFPINEDLSHYEVPYYPEAFTEEEKYLLDPFFTNLDEAVFIFKNLPSETIGALSSRYSRAEGGIRRVFFEEYIKPIIQPENQKDWETFTDDQKTETLAARAQFYEYVEFLHTVGGLDNIVNLQRSRNFYHRWLSQFGDDSIAEMGTSVTLCIEGISNMAVNTIQGQRIGVSSLEKSSRYVFFGDKNPNGDYKFVVPGEIRGTELENEYREVMTLLFDTYVALLPVHLAHIKELYPKDVDETERSFEASRRAKVFDDLRELLPFSTQTSLGLNISGRAAEQLINRLLSDPNGEVRWWGQQVSKELLKVIPSFIERPMGKRGAEQQSYRRQLKLLGRGIASTLPVEPFVHHEGPGVNLVSYTPNPDIEILTAYCFEGAEGISLAEIRDAITRMTEDERFDLLKRILELRNMGEENTDRAAVRFRKPPRAFEAAVFMMDILCRGGDYRDLHRHRTLTQGRQLLTTDWGYDLEPEVSEAIYMDQINYALMRAADLNQKLAEINKTVSQYVVPFAFLQRFYWGVNAREIYWISELRTGPQGRPHYREIVQEISALVSLVAPGVFQGMRTDYNEYGLARRESEKKIDRKLGKN